MLCRCALFDLIGAMAGEEDDMRIIITTLGVAFSRLRQHSARRS
jgi:hypothetical protein